ncbi:MAG TPA: anaerobic ribonucleoside-triphosphate reductase [Blastocatellia bacterium]|nr:anaerobic ribonucleoside-triphosphate reductase [Blastocatellia bacterium]
MDPEPLDPQDSDSPGITEPREVRESMELELLVRKSDEDVALFDSHRIVETLVTEAHLDSERARQISHEIRSFIDRVGLRTLSTSLIRGLVDAKLLEYGLEDAYRAHTRLGVPLHDIDRLMHDSRRAEASTPHGPEGTSLILAEAIKREYAIQSVLSEAVANAHLVGDIHIQDLGAIDRPYSLVTTIDFVKRHGIALPQGFASARPARRPGVLIAQIVKFSAALQGYLSGPIVWDSLNFTLAPFLEGLGENDLKQLAQTLLFEFSAPAVARGGQALVCDVHLDWEAPEYLANRPAIGPGGEELPRNYSDYAETAHAFLRALLGAYMASDARGRPFASPRCILHITERFNEQAGYRSLLDLASRVATERGGLKIAFDRKEESTFFSRYGISDKRAIERTDSASWRSASFGVVALNLPRVGYLAVDDQVRVFEELTRLMEAAAQAHLEKRVFLEKLLAQGEQGPLSMLAMRAGHAPFVRLSWTAHWISPVGLNELVRAVLGHQMHENPAAYEFAGRVVGHLRREADRLSNKHNVRFVISESCDEATSSRLARLDLRFFGKAAASVVDAVEPDGSDASYTPGLRLSARADVSAFERLRSEGALHPHGVLNAGSEIWFGSTPPTPDQVAVLTSQAFFQTTVAAISFAPEFTVCFECGELSTGLHSACASCGSARVDGLALSGDRHSLTSGWDAGRRAELADRCRVTF